MPRYQITAPDGRVVTVEGDTAPTEADAESIFASLPAREAAPDPLAGLSPQERRMGRAEQAASASASQGFASVPYDQEGFRSAFGFELPAAPLASRIQATGTGGLYASRVDEQSPFEVFIDSPQGVRRALPGEVLSYAQAAAQPRVGAEGAAARQFLRDSPAATAGYYAAAQASRAMQGVGATPLGRVAQFGVPLAAGIGAALTTGGLQQVGAETLAEGEGRLADLAQAYLRSQQEDITQQPTAALVGGLAAQLPTAGFGFNPGITARQGLVSSGVGGGIGGGVQALQELQNPNDEGAAGRVALAALGGAVMQRDTNLGRRLGGSVPVPKIEPAPATAASDAAQAASQIKQQGGANAQATLTQLSTGGYPLPGNMRRPSPAAAPEVAPAVRDIVGEQMGIVQPTFEQRLTELTGEAREMGLPRGDAARAGFEAAQKQVPPRKLRDLLTAEEAAAQEVEKLNTRRRKVDAEQRAAVEREVEAAARAERAALQQQIADQKKAIQAITGESEADVLRRVRGARGRGTPEELLAALNAEREYLLNPLSNPDRRIAELRPQVEALEARAQSEREAFRLRDEMEAQQAQARQQALQQAEQLEAMLQQAAASEDATLAARAEVQERIGTAAAKDYADRLRRAIAVVDKEGLPRAAARALAGAETPQEYSFILSELRRRSGYPTESFESPSPLVLRSLRDLRPEDVGVGEVPRPDIDELAGEIASDALARARVAERIAYENEINLRAVESADMRDAVAMQGAEGDIQQQSGLYATRDYADRLRRAISVLDDEGLPRGAARALALSETPAEYSFILNQLRQRSGRPAPTVEPAPRVLRSLEELTPETVGLTPSNALPEPTPAIRPLEASPQAVVQEAPQVQAQAPRVDRRQLLRQRAAERGMVRAAEEPLPDFTASLDIESSKRLLSPSQLEEVNELERLRYMSVARQGPEAGYKPYAMSAAERQRLNELGQKYRAMYVRPSSPEAPILPASENAPIVENAPSSIPPASLPATGGVTTPQAGLEATPRPRPLSIRERERLGFLDRKFTRTALSEAEEAERRTLRGRARALGEAGFVSTGALANIAAPAVGAVTGFAFGDTPEEKLTYAAAGAALAAGFGYGVRSVLNRRAPIPGAPASRPKGEPMSKSFKDVADKYLGSISTRIRNISPEIHAALIRYELRTRTLSNNYRGELEPFFKAVKVLSPEDKVAVDIAVKNGDVDAARAVFAKYDADKAKALNDGLDRAYKAFNEVGDAAAQVGYEFGRQDNYWPRKVVDYDGFLESVGATRRGPLLDAIKAAEIKEGRPLTIEEKTDIVNATMRGARTRGIDWRPASMKARTVEQITADLNKFYAPMEQSALGYVERMIPAIEQRVFFGRTDGNTEQSIGGITAKMVEDGAINAKQEQELRDILTARFKAEGLRANPIVAALKSGGYISTLGNPVSALTQVGDLFFAAYKNGYYKAAQAALGKRELKLQDLGIEKIAQEFDKDPGALGRLLEKTFKYSGFNKIDELGKETLINSGLRRLRQDAQVPTTKKQQEDFAYLERTWRPVFGEEFDSFVSDLRNKVNSENVKLALFMQLSDMQPISLSEMPVGYLENPNGRIFYALKTFMLKQWDILRRDVVREVATGNPGVAAKNFMAYTLAVVLAGLSGDALKDFVLGRETQFDDAVATNLLRLFGLSKYTYYRAQREGAGTAAVEMVTPPAVSIANNIWKDVSDPKVYDDPITARSVNNIPYVGRFLNWYFGRGAQREEQRELDERIGRNQDK